MIPSPIVGLLDLEQLDQDHFSAVSWPESGRHMYGGQVVAQALRAATLTVDPRFEVQSMHSYFVAAGDPSAPVEISVERVRDGRSFATRRVVSGQRDKAIFILEASFHVSESGGQYQVPMTPDLPAPDDERSWPPGMGPSYFAEMFELRDFLPEAMDERGLFRSTRRFWVRTRHRLADDPALHAVVLAYASDCATLLGADAPIGAYGHTGMRTSLDHCIWFHRPARIDEWVLVDYQPVSNAGARGLLLGKIHTIDGELVATAAQEVLTRPNG